MPPLPLFLMSAGGAAAFVIGLCVRVAENPLAARYLSWLFSMGPMALTWYFGHILIGLGAVEAFGLAQSQSLPAAMATGGCFFAIAVLVSWLWKKRFRHGPLEWVMRKVTGRSWRIPCASDWLAATIDDGKAHGKNELYCERETMIVDDSGERLHDRATRGDVLSSEERSRLERWYREQDESESASLVCAPDSLGIADLQAQVNAAVAHMLTVAHRIDALVQENEAVRQEIGRLQTQLVQKAKAQPA